MGGWLLFRSVSARAIAATSARLRIMA